MKGTEYEGTGISPPTPGYVLRKYVGTFRAEEKDGYQKEVKIELRRQMLYLVQGFVIKKKATEVEDEVVATKKSTRGAKTTAKGAAKGVQSGRITKTKAAPKPQVKANSLEAAMADSPALRKATTSSTTPTPQTAAVTTATTSPAQAIITTPLFLDINGVPKFRIGGATKEEKELNKELQGVGRLGPGGVLVSFDVKMGEMKGGRVAGEMFTRVEE